MLTTAVAVMMGVIKVHSHMPISLTFDHHAATAR
jgi:hypothetical protein